MDRLRILWAFCGFWATASIQAQNITLTTYGFAPPVGFPEETVIFRVDYINPENLEVKIDTNYNWSPLELSMYEHRHQGEESSLIFYLKIPTIDSDSLIVVKDLPLYVKDSNERTKVLYVSDTLIIKNNFEFDELSRPLGLRKIKKPNSISGSWWIGTWLDWSFRLKDGAAFKDAEVLKVPHNTFLWIYGLNSELVRKTLSKWPQGKFYVWIEGALELYRWFIDDSKEGLFTTFSGIEKIVHIEKYNRDTLEISHIPVFGRDQFSFNQWNLVVRAHKNDSNHGKVIAVFKIGDKEIFRKYLEIYVIEIPNIYINSSTYSYIQNYVSIKDIKYPINSSLSIYAHCYYSFGFTNCKQDNGIIHRNLYINIMQYVNRLHISSFVRRYESFDTNPGGDRLGHDFDFYSTLIADGNIFYTVSPGKSFPDSYSPPRKNREYFILGSLIDVQNINLNISADYKYYWFGGLARSSQISESINDRNSLSLFEIHYYLNIDKDSIIYIYGHEHAQLNYYTQINYEGKFTKTLDDASEGTLPEDQITVDFLVNPQVVKLQDLEANLAERPQVEFIVQVRQEDLPVSGLPVEVIGPVARDALPDADSPLWLPEPRQTDSYGHYAFYWTPPHRSWFDDKEMPYRFQFTIRIGEDRYYNLLVEVANLIIVGRVWQRHAGALNDPTDKRPLIGVEISLDPNFPPGQTLRTGEGGYFELGVKDPGRYVVYARRPEYWEDGFPKWTRTQAVVQVEEEGPNPDTLELYLAALPVGPLRRKWAPSLQQTLMSSKEGAIYGAALAKALAYLDELSVQSTTDSLDEEAWRRLQLGLFSAYQTLEGAQVLAACGVSALWDTYFGLVLQVVDKLVDGIKLVATLRDILRQRLKSLSPNSPEAVQLQRQLRQLDELIAKTDEIVKKIRSKIEKELKDLEVGIASTRQHPNPDPRVLQTLEFLRDRVYRPILKHLENLNLLEIWQGATWNITGWLTQWSGRLNELLEGVRNRLADGLLDGLRGEVSSLLEQEVTWARARSFPLYPLGYRDAHRSSTALLRQMEQERQTLQGLCEGLQGLREQVGAVLDMLNASALAISAASAWTLTPFLAAVTTAANTVTLVLSTAAGLHVGTRIGDAVSREGSYARLGLGAMRKAFSVEEGALAVRVHSPVHLLVVDRQGRRLGRGADGRYYDEIPGGSYLPNFEGEGETIWLPVGIDSFQVWIQGIASGSYRLSLLQAAGQDSVVILKSWEGYTARGALARLTVENGDVSEELVVEEDAPVSVRLLWEGIQSDTLTVALGGMIRLRAEQERQGSWIPLLGGDWMLEDSTRARLQVVDADLIVEGIHTGQTTLRLNLSGREYAWQLQVIGLEVQVLVDSVVQLGQQVPITVRLWRNGSQAASEAVQLIISGAFGKWQTQGTTDVEGQFVVNWTVDDTVGVGPISLTVWHVSDSLLLGSRTVKVIRGSYNQETLEEEIYQENVLVGRLRIEREAWGSALAPLLLREVVLPDSLPWRLPASYKPLSIGISFGLLDEASAELIQPQRPMTLWLRGETGGEIGLLWNGQNWEEIEIAEEEGSWYRMQLPYSWGIVVVVRRESIVRSTPLEKLPEHMTIDGPYPHPVGAAMQFRLAVPRSGRLQVGVYDLMGREVARLLDGQTAAGWYELRWEADHLASGLYFIYLQSGDAYLIKPFIKVR